MLHRPRENFMACEMHLLLLVTLNDKPGALQLTYLTQKSIKEPKLTSLRFKKFPAKQLYQQIVAYFMHIYFINYSTEYKYY